MPVRTQVGANAREQQAQVVEKLRRRTEGRAHVGYTWALAQRKRGGHVRDLVDRALAAWEMRRRV